MNKRQRKKKAAAQPLTLILSCKQLMRADDYIHLRRLISEQLQRGGAVLLPPYLQVEAIIKGSGSRQVIIKQISEGAEHEQKTSEKEI